MNSHFGQMRKFFANFVKFLQKKSNFERLLSDFYQKSSGFCSFDAILISFEKRV